MARTSGPLFSQEASGSIGDALTFSNWKGRTYVKKFSQPTNTNTAAQISARAMHAFLNSNWAAVAAIPANLATWQELAAQTGTSPIAAYLSYNLKRWAHFTAPTQAWPAAQTGTWGVPNAIGIATVNGNTVTITNTLTAVNQNWADALHRSQTPGFASSQANVIQITLHNFVGAHPWTDAGLAAGTYYYRITRWTTTGKILAHTLQRTAIVP